MVVVGGLGRRTGVVIASAFFALFPSLIAEIGWLNDFISDTLHREPDHFTLIIGALLALEVIVLAPAGLGGRLSPLTTWLGGARFSLHPERGGGHKEKKPRTGARDRLMKRLGLAGPEAPVLEQAAEPAAEPADEEEERVP
jgi:hypothetical protein